METKIPKIIHYCWFGGKEKPQLVLMCIDSWKRNCPEFEIVEWNESNFDVHSNSFVDEAYQAKKWAFVSDYVRGEVLSKYGGIYLDTDMEILCPLDSFLDIPFFAGFETKDIVAAGIIGCEKGSIIIDQYAVYYKDKHFCRYGEKTITTSPVVLTDALCKIGLKLNGRMQCVSGCYVYPKHTFYPTDLRWVFGKYGAKTIAVHHYMYSWRKNPSMKEQTRLTKLRISLVFFARNLLGTNNIRKISKLLRGK